MEELPMITYLQKQIDELGDEIEQFRIWMNEQMEAQRKRAQIKKDLDDQIEKLSAKQ